MKLLKFNTAAAPPRTEVGYLTAADVDPDFKIITRASLPIGSSSLAVLSDANRIGPSRVKTSNLPPSGLDPIQGSIIISWEPEDFGPTLAVGHESAEMAVPAILARSGSAEAGRFISITGTGVYGYGAIGVKGNSGNGTAGYFETDGNTNSAPALHAVNMVTGGTGAALKIEGSLEVRRRAVAGGAVAGNARDYLVSYTAVPPGGSTFTMPNPAAFADRMLILKVEVPLPPGVVVTVVSFGTETIDGAATATIAASYGVLRFYTNGTNWFTF